MPRPTAIVTGGSRGIGRAIVLELAHTHDLIATFKSRRDAAESLRSEAEGIEIFQCDVCSAHDRTSLIEFARRKFDRLDLLVNNAGMAPRERRDVLEASEESFDELIGTNLKGPHFLTREAARWMSGQHSGRVIFITSISAYAVSTNRAEYCISKAALSMAAAVWAQRLAADGIRVFEIRPGVIRTDMVSAVVKSYEERIAAGLVPQRRLGEPSDVARVVRAIANGLLDYSVGQAIGVDGGFQIRSL
jgi:NAD(P)-dependent dehydrogenase (short-subunit alcohol dehydrogenase family)